MRSLIIDSATEACSVALFDGTDMLDGRFERLGRGHAERLVPMIAELPGNGRADRIVVALGPGSFTGVRIGLAAARALGLAWQTKVLGYPSFALIAAMAQAQHNTDKVSVAMTGGHGEWFVQNFSGDTQPDGDLRSLKPDDAAQYAAHDLVAGTQAAALIERRGHGSVLEILPDARCFASLPAHQLTTELSPFYGRPPDAKLPGGKTLNSPVA
ncbi:tRNA (adenosine(37)-N6)-threonylcarbamoyltransferase complex dimerization subunit type 1 TsaB [Altericroceibacterium endophyticum]|uniref:tRNA (Adenosine(37)-N6)-threonylcarbamoyltransferase complex dimerization subunit type 1 TsaB n=1 Tax=Altericroceibacterium endophyticum TaxID=1808508 RepID=A0A6I4T7U1_9SPHN|nr:tRNA (adenosine(37)-N6)-threonylcarbamoyltransferase complex dimerization subunit type 1 TsaB [Altericroceibacterium endophyticum]MXO66857.1 tRNA (adenosine(37)-N6)-threonylcarbamoyltransferase complex dimerization subunit type 1 TsaB [Altericroceibacterium endophyticum]